MRTGIDSRVQRRLFATLAPWLLLALAGCGGGGDDGVPKSATSLEVSGLAATGAAMANAIVSVKCVAGPTVSGLTGVDGRFSLRLQSGQTLPCMVKVTRGDPAVTLYSLSESEGPVNVTPLTDLALARALAGDSSAAFLSFNAAKAASLRDNLPLAKNYVVAQALAITGQSPSGDIFTQAFTIGGADDQLLDALGQSMTAANKSLSDLRTAAQQGSDLKAVLEASGDGPSTPPEPD